MTPSPFVIPAKAGISRFGPRARPQEDASLRWHDVRGRRHLSGVALAFLLLTACSAQPDAPGAVTANEARQLNDAAAMLDANSVDANALADTTNATTNESTP
ncbi:hypothetical protein [Sphingomonas ginsenosidivorax]|uniref:hypothetical protein n=1 Tax=Sphingomonas ginsenosidivorax TaxID=862135 RepID=UPI001F54FB20|nr:hypothetical protein [Sphingomonas ginsenosidivorax]